MNAPTQPNGGEPRPQAPGAMGAPTSRVPMSAPGSEQGSRGGIDDEGVAGERGIPSVNRVRSMQSRVTSMLAIGCLSLIGFGLLGWYYTQALTRQHRAVQAAESHVTERARSEMTLPPLGHLTPPRVLAPQSVPPSSTLETLVGSAPEVPESAPAATSSPYPGSPPVYGPSGAPYGAQAEKSPAQLATDRRLGGPIFSARPVRTPAIGADTASGSSGAPAWTEPTSAGGLAAAASIPGGAVPVAQTTSDPGTLSPHLRASLTPAVQAQVLPTQRFLLPKGAFLDCTLETAIDSTLPGLTTCVTATDSFGVDGTTVLIERGSKLVGETQGQMAPGTARVFVLWTEVRTPTGVVVALNSPGTDELGRAGFPGNVHRHFFERFGAAMLISVLDAAVQSATRPSGNGGAFIYNPSGSEALATEALKGTVSIPPTLTKHQGDRIQVLVARDLDFRTVYDLRASSAPR
jgi:type IV secretion system protein VirB10